MNTDFLATWDFPEYLPNRAIQTRLRSDPLLLRATRSLVEQMAQAAGFDEDQCYQIQLAVDEALTNIYRHAYHGRRDGLIDLQLRYLISDTPREEPGLYARGEGLEILIRDEGDAVDPSIIVGRDLLDVRAGGLGVHLIRSAMDLVEYRCRPERGMLLRMIRWKARKDWLSMPD